MYSYLLYKIIYVIFLDVGTHLGPPGTLEIGPNCPNFKFSVFDFSGFKFSGCIHISYIKLPVKYFLGVGTHLGTPGTLKIGSSCQNFNILSLVIDVSNFHDLLLWGLEKYQLC